MKFQVGNELKNNDLSIEELRSWLDMDEYGVLRWKRFRASTAQAGEIAGKIGTLGYVEIGFKGRTVLAHRVVWAFSYGSWPALYIDHINGNTSDNRPCNLREATHSQNLVNSVRKRKNSNLPRGVTSSDGGKYKAQIAFNHEKKHLGTFDTPEEASLAYIAAATELHGGYFPGKPSIVKELDDKRRRRKEYKRSIRLMTEADLAFVANEISQEQKRRRLQVRERRKAKGAETTVTISLGEPEKLWPLSDSALVDAARGRW